MDEQEQFSSQAQEATSTTVAADAPEAAVMHVTPAVSFDDSTQAQPAPMAPADPEPKPEDASYAQPVPSGAIGAMLDAIHAAVEYASDEVRDTVRSLVRRTRDMI